MAHALGLNVSLLLRCFITALCVLLVTGVLAIASFNVAAALGWPGLLIVNAICGQFGIYLHDFPAWTWLIPGLLIDLLLYTLLFFVCAKLWRTLVKSRRKQQAMAIRRRPTT
jgi:hypothetical protein